MKLRSFVIPWIAGVLTWFIVTWSVNLFINANSDPDRISTVIAAAWAGLLLAPVLTAAVAVLLLPLAGRGQVPSALLAGVPVTAVIVGWRLLTVESQIGSGPMVSGVVVTILLAAAVSTSLALIFRRRTQ